jgi:predicted transcriptional regulator
MSRKEMYETGLKEYLYEFTRYGQKPPSKKDLAKMLGVSESCLNHWLAGRRPEPETVKQHLKLLRYLKNNACQIHDRIWQYSFRELVVRELLRKKREEPRRATMSSAIRF